MITFPKISIVVPNFNQAAFLGKTLDSILTQAYPNLELILIDGGSTDASLGVIAEYQDRLAYSISEQDKGHHDAVNKGFARATGEILGFLNSDDKLFPGALRIVGEAFASYPNVDWTTILLPSYWDVTGSCFGVCSMSRYSRSSRNLKLDRVPVLNRLLRETVGYPARRLVRTNPGSQQATWQLQDYRFL